MWELRHKVRTFVSGMLPRHAMSRRVAPGSGADWLPPVLGPDDWSIGMIADHSVGWYFDRRS